MCITLILLWKPWLMHCSLAWTACPTFIISCNFPSIWPFESTMQITCYIHVIEKIHCYIFIFLPFVYWLTFFTALEGKLYFDFLCRSLADTDADGKMNIEEFSIACKLINLKLRNFELPKVLPPSLLQQTKPLGMFVSFIISELG